MKITALTLGFLLLTNFSFSQIKKKELNGIWRTNSEIFFKTDTIKFYRNGLLIGTMQTVLPSSGTVSGGGYQYYKIGTMTDNSNPMTADLGELKVYKTQKTLIK